MEVPVCKTKMEGVNQEFDLSDPAEREKYFKTKAGKEIEKLRTFFKEKGSFIAYLLGKKNAGKGTYSKMFTEVIGKEYIKHISIGDMVREVEEEMQDKNKKKEIEKYLRKNYRGFVSIDDVLKSFADRNTKIL
ncbi:MAG: hypothetical protein KAS78_00175, partial [Candidatus Pacebacteria bacterium]|nr:hypothetical protein [Candidatus Paceibacterota bacterium]